ncbi:molybdopterin molybdotransferase MoeA [Georgenia ruanii]|uniref:Molybdopterin molybdenumtransferase n=1 Tax=Georgenia ruanii TaxID=348442 RepID=A0A7J9UZR6_9MICO|nr:gephyrin-like molybdotransferase Glp [Georgenia ruanii]MPV89932.1 molybdopterin molybdenumtransferase MoeA [Georgenia ruanii]
MITVEQHLERVLAAVRPLAPQRLPLDQAHGCVLAEEVTALLAVPPFDNSAMDGFAVRAADVAAADDGAPVRLRVVGDVPAGSAARPPVEPGTAVRVMTGAPVPPGADAVVPVEHTDQAAGPGQELPAVVEVRRPAAPGAHLRGAGEDVSPGAVVLRAGTPLRARDLSTAASVGHGTLLVHPPVRVGVLSTGSELVPPGQTPGAGQIPDSNHVLVAGMVREAGAVPVLLGAVADDAAALRARLAENLGRVEAVVTTGGVSAGAYDVVKEVLAPLGEVTFDQVAMQPGKPQGFGVLREGAEAGPGAPSDPGLGVPIFCLPGNPVSVFVSFQVFVAPALSRLRALVADAGAPAAAVAATGWRCPPGRRQYMPVVVDGTDDTGALRVRPATAGGSGSHLVASLAQADALAVVDAEVDAVREGDAVRVMMVP